MGACGSSSAAAREARRMAEELDRKNRVDWERQQQNIKLLLLGTIMCSTAGVAGTPQHANVQLPRKEDVYKALLINICVCMDSGAGESGKSTIFKQMRIIYGKGFTSEDRSVFTHVVYNNVISSMQTLLQACTDFGYPIICQVQQ